MRLPSSAGEPPEVRVKSGERQKPAELPGEERERPLEVRPVRRAPDEQPVGGVADRRLAALLSARRVPGLRDRRREVEEVAGLDGLRRAAQPEHVDRRVVPDPRDRPALPRCGRTARERGRRNRRGDDLGGRRGRDPHDAVRGDVAANALAAPRVAHGERADRGRGAEAEVDALILRREIAASRLHDARQAPAVGERDGDDRARGEPGQLHVEPVPARACRARGARACRRSC